MSGMGLTHAGGGSGATRWALAAVVLIAVIVVGAAAWGVLRGKAPVTSDVAAPAATAVVTGNERCSVTSQGRPVNDVEWSSRVVTCDVTASDGRVSGEAVRTVTHQEFAAEPGPFGLERVEFGDLELTGVGSHWQGWMVGGGAPDAIAADFVLVGDGPVAGLVYRGASTQTGDGWRLGGSVEPLDADAVVGFVTMGPTAESARRAVDGETAGLEFTWSIESADGRVSGTATQRADHEFRADGTERMAGTITLTGGAATWSGPFEWDTASSPHLRTGVLAGTGSAADRQLRYAMRTFDGYHYLLDAVIEPRG